MKETNWKELIEKRVLLETTNIYNLIEAKVNQISPNGLYIQLEFTRDQLGLSKHTEWVSKYKYKVADVLE